MRARSKGKECTEREGARRDAGSRTRALERVYETPRAREGTPRAPAGLAGLEQLGGLELEHEAQAQQESEREVTTLRRITDGIVLEGLPADKPVAGLNPFTTVAGTEFWPTDGSPPEITGYDAFGNIQWYPLFGGGGGVTVASAGSPIAVSAGPAFLVGYSIPGQALGDVAYYNGVAWVRLPAGAPGDVLTVTAGAPAWVAPSGGASVLAGDGIGVSGGPAYTVSVAVPGQANGDLLARVGGAWVRVPVGTAGQVLTVVAGLPAWAASGGGGVTLTGGDGILVTGGPAYTATFGFVGEQSGDIAYCQAPGSWARLQKGNNNDVLNTTLGFPTWNPTGAFQQFDFYLAGFSGNDGNDGLTPATAVKTVARCFELMPSVITGQVIVHTAPEPIFETVTANWSAPERKGQNAKWVLFDAPLSLVPLAPPLDTVTGGTQGSGVTFGQITVAGPLVVGALAGKIVEFLTGANTGKRYRVADNGLAFYTFCSALLFPPAIGDTFRTVEESVQLFLAPPTPTPGFVPFGGVTFSGFAIQTATSILVIAAPFGLNCCSLRDVTGTVVVANRGNISTANELLSPTPSIGFSPECGPDLASPIFVRDGARLDFTGFRSLSVVTGITGAVIEQTNGYYAATGAIDLRNSNGTLTNIVAAAPSNNPFLNVREQSTCSVSEMEIANGAGDGIVVQRNSYFDGFGIIGIGNVGTGLVVARSSRASIPDAGVTTTITGGLGDCLVGANAGPSTWAQILGGLVADVTDTTAAVPTYCAVQV